MNINVVQIDDESLFHHKIQMFLKDDSVANFKLTSFSTFEDMTKSPAIMGAADIFLVDFELKSRRTGADVIKYLKTKYSNIPCVLLTSHAKMEYINEAIRAGAVDFLWKSGLTKDFLRSIILKYTQKALQTENIQIDLDSIPFPVFGKTLKTHIKEAVKLLSFGPSINYLEGEKGVGKTHFYRCLKSYLTKHRADDVTLGYFDCVDPQIKIEDAFRFDGATVSPTKSADSLVQTWLFFDNIHLLNPSEQLRLYENLSENFLLYRKYNLKVFCASSKSLYKLAETDSFRPDLAHLLSLYQKQISSYKERSREEKIELINFLLSSVSSEERELTIPAVELLVHSNFRLENLSELKKTLTFMSEQATSKYVTPGDFPKGLLMHSQDSIKEQKLIINDRALINSTFDVVCNEVFAVVLQERISSLPAKDRTISKLAISLGINRKTLSKRLNVLLENKSLDPKYDIREKE